jgi:predicted deacylase
MTGSNGSFVFRGEHVVGGERRQFELPAGRLASGVFLNVPVEVVCGARPGPVVWLSGAIHGDEIVGVEIIRQVLDQLEPEELAGTVIAAPVVNVFGFVMESRYLPLVPRIEVGIPGLETRPALHGRGGRPLLVRTGLPRRVE